MKFKNQPLVTIAIPTYNRGEKFLTHALGCALNQTYEHLEIIVSDNASTDNTEAVVKSFSDPRIHYIKQEKNLGANNNFNFCLNTAKGEYLLLLLDDDLIDSDLIQLFVDSLSFNPDAGVLFSGTRVIDEETNILWQSNNNFRGMPLDDFILGWFANKTPLYLCSTLFKTEKLKEIGGLHSKHNLYQDTLASLTLAAKYGRIDIPDIKASFRIHSDNMGGKLETIHAWCEDCMHLLNTICEFPLEKKDRIRLEGLRFFAMQNYNMAIKIQSPIKRIKTYFMINRVFEGIYPPYQLYYNRHIKPMEYKLKQAIKKLIGR